jgi:hypothetical protein
MKLTLCATFFILICSCNYSSEKNIHQSSLKSKLNVSFNDFKSVSIDNKSKAKLDLSSLKDANQFKTKLTEAYNADTANFAGHFTFVYWGCGSPCKMSMIIDRQTGKIYDAPASTIGYECQSYSNMLLVNPPSNNLHSEYCEYCEPVIYVFDVKSKTFFKKSL